MFLDGRVADGGEEDALCEEGLGDLQGAGFVADLDGDDGGGGCGGDSVFLQAMAEVVYIILKLLDASGFGFEDVEGGFGCGQDGGGEAGGEDEAAGCVAELVDEELGAAGVAAFAGEGFGEGSHEDVRLVFRGEAEVLADAVAGGAYDAGGVGFVDHGKKLIAVGDGQEPGQVGDIAVHAEDGVGDDETAAGGVFLDFFLEVLHIVVTIDDDFGAAQAAAVDDAGVVELVAEDDAVFGAECLEDADVCHVAGVVEQGGFCMLEAGEGFLQLCMERQCTGGQAGAAGAGAEEADGILGRGFYARLVDEAEVAVGCEHEQVLSAA